MKHSLLIFALLLSLDSIAQDSLKMKISTEICSCITAVTDARKGDLQKCIHSTFDQNKALIMARMVEVYNNPLITKGEGLAERFGDKLMGDISSGLVVTCDPFYHIMDTSRFSFMNSTDKHSIEKIIRKSRYDKKDAAFFLKRGALYLQLMDVDHSIEDFETAARLDSNNLKSIYFKALALELKKDYDGASVIYSNLLSLSQVDQYRMFIAIVKRKKSEYNLHQ